MDCSIDIDLVVDFSLDLLVVEFAVDIDCFEGFGEYSSRLDCSWKQRKKKGLKKHLDYFVVLIAVLTSSSSVWPSFLVHRQNIRFHLLVAMKD